MGTATRGSARPKRDVGGSSSATLLRNSCSVWARCAMERPRPMTSARYESGCSYCLYRCSRRRRSAASVRGKQRTTRVPVVEPEVMVPQSCGRSGSSHARMERCQCGLSSIVSETGQSHASHARKRKSVFMMKM